MRRRDRIGGHAGDRACERLRAETRGVYDHTGGDAHGRGAAGFDDEPRSPAVAQGYFLGRTLGEDSVCLFGEDRPGIRVLPPAAFLEATDQYPLVVNVDSLTEMAAETAEAYRGAIKARAGVFLSVNHGANPFTVREVCAKVGMPVISRMPYWSRRGYVEEVSNSAP